MTDYASFIKSKSQSTEMAGFDPIWIPDVLFPFQRHLTNWSIRKGRSAIYADCGMGKTPMQLVWAENVVRHTNKPVLVLTPLAVAGQTAREADKFGIDAKVSRDGTVHPNITVTNYEQLHKFNAKDFSGVVGDEFSCCKSMDGKRRLEVTEFLRELPYRLLCTATAAPNDYIELGTSSEALGELGQMDMITRFFKQETKKDYLGWGRTKYRLRGHAELPFWKWVCSWARACRKPSDLGFDDDGFKLPPLVETVHVVKPRTPTPGYIFDMPARDMREERAERRRTIQERCEKAAELVSDGRTATVWCHLNDEGDLLEKLIKGSKQVCGADSDEEKEETYEAFASGQLKTIINKPVIGAWGLNWQHCSHVVTFASHSYEQYYQLVRRCWRFGQLNQVDADVIATEGEQRVSENLARKAAAADKMFTVLVECMNDAIQIDRSLHFTERMKIPSWLNERKTPSMVG